MQREAFLAYRLSIGIARRAVRSTAATLLQVVRLLNLTEPRPVTRGEVATAAKTWAAEVRVNNVRGGGPNSARVFSAVALLFLDHSCLLVHPEESSPFSSELQSYLRMLENRRGLTRETIAGCKGHLQRFFRWMAAPRASLRDIKASDILEYLSQKAQKCSDSSVRVVEGALRSFFNYAAEQNWVQASTFAVFYDRRWQPAGSISAQTLSWEEVQQLIASTAGEDATSLRGRAVMLLCAVYGLRASEVARLAMCDLNWTSGTISIRRSKSGVFQCMPLRPEVADALVSYLHGGRPSCTCRNVFVTRQRPHRAMRAANIGLVVRRCMLDRGMIGKRLGPHSLRHACATKLLQSGCSLREIADFLGHRDLKSVSIYAKCDLKALHDVAAFPLRDVL